MGCFMDGDDIKVFKDEVVGYTKWKEEYQCLVANQPKCPDSLNECDEVDAIDPVEMVLFNDLSFCGEKSEISFLNATRIDTLTSECPEGTLPCSVQTSNENTICMAPSEA